MDIIFLILKKLLGLGIMIILFGGLYLTWKNDQLPRYKGYRLTKKPKKW